MKKFISGFSLIELMIVVAIIGILAVIALPSYQNYANRAKFTEVIQAAAPFKLAVEACAHEQPSLSDCINANDGSGQHGIPPAISNPDTAKSYVKSIQVEADGNQGIKIISISQHIGRSSDAYRYILTGSLQQDGRLLWQKDPQSTCIAKGYC